MYIISLKRYRMIICIVFKMSIPCAFICVPDIPYGPEIKHAEKSTQWLSESIGLKIVVDNKVHSIIAMCAIIILIVIIALSSWHARLTVYIYHRTIYTLNNLPRVGTMPNT